MVSKQTIVNATLSVAVVLSWGQYASAMYDPMFGRFASRDPIVYEGGSNQYEFVNSQTLSFTDPTGEITVSVEEKEFSQKCGDRHSIKWTFKLDNKAPCDGYIVQMVEVRCQTNSCVDCPNTSPAMPTATYWEAWFVKEGEQLEETHEIDPFTDLFDAPVLDMTCGTNSQIGTIKFFCKTTTGDLGRMGKPNAGSGWKVGATYGSGNCTLSPGGIPSTGSMPGWWGNAPQEGSAYRAASIYWSCCNCKPRFVMPFATPE